jgi:hypothetical protein
MARTSSRRWKGCAMCKPWKFAGYGDAERMPYAALRQFPTSGGQRVSRHDVGLWDSGGKADWAEREAVAGECRHGCNGDCLVLGSGSEVCDFLCHPGLSLDPVRAARTAAIEERFGLWPLSAPAPW